MEYKSKLMFSNAMIGFGLIPPNNIIADAKVHLCQYNKDGIASNNGWYIFSKIKPAIGLFGCFDLNRSKRWQNTKTESLIDNERSEYLKRIYKLRYVVDKYKTSTGNTDRNVKDVLVNSDEFELKCFNKVRNYVIKNCEYKRSNPKCKSCDRPECTNRIAKFLFDTYGENTSYRVSLTKIGIAMGLPDPDIKYKKDNKEQNPAYKKEKSQIKSQVRRWINWKKPLKKKRHTETPIVTP